MISVKSVFIARLYNVEYNSLETTLQEIKKDLNRKVTETKSESDEIIDRFFIKHEKKAIFEQWKNNSEQFFIDCKKKEERQIREDCETIFKVVRQKQEIYEKFNLCRRQIVSEVRDLFLKFKDEISFDVSDSVNNLFSDFWGKWKSSFENSNFDFSDISSDMQQVSLNLLSLND